MHPLLAAHSQAMVDPFIWGPNAVGVLFGGVQILLLLVRWAGQEVL